MPVTAKAFKALGDSGRLRIFEILLEGPRHVSELVLALSIPQPHVSKHLRVLKDAGLVEDFRHGRWVEYRVARDVGAIPSQLSQWGNALAERLASPRGTAPAPTSATRRPPHDSDEPRGARFVVRKPEEAFDAYLL